MRCADDTAPESAAMEAQSGCADGDEPEVQTPGQTTLQAQNSALGGALQLTTNANSIGGLLASVATSFLNTLVSAAISTATKAATKGLTQMVLSATAGGPSSNGGVSPTGPTAPSSTVATMCSPNANTGIMQVDYPFSATGGDGQSYTWSVPTGAFIRRRAGLKHGLRLLQRDGDVPRGRNWQRWKDRNLRHGHHAIIRCFQRSEKKLPGCLFPAARGVIS